MLQEAAALCAYTANIHCHVLCQLCKRKAVYRGQLKSPALTFAKHQFALMTAFLVCLICIVHHHLTTTDLCSHVE